MEFFDTHCHLADRAFRADLPAVLARAWRAGLVGAVCVGYDLDSSRAAVRLAEQDPRLWAAVGIHPHYVAQADPDFPDRLAELARHPRVVAIGESGLDYYRDLSPRSMQRAAFQRHIELAQKLGLPIIVHDRDAHQETLEVLAAAFGPAPAADLASPGRPVGVMHCFSGDAAMALASVELGLAVSFAGPITYPRADQTREAAAAVPADRLLVETDCPYLAPQSRRGRRNEPAWVAEVLAAAAAARSESPAAIARYSTNNARNLFLPAGDSLQGR